MRKRQAMKNTPIRCHNRRGFTVIELTVVLAVSAIVFTMVASFSGLVSAQVKRNRLRTDFLAAVSDCKLTLQTQCAALDGQGAEISVSDLDVPKSDLYTYEFTLTEGNQYLKCTFTHASEGLRDEVSFLLSSHCGATFKIEGATE
ncbi:MAG: type II secretion system protein [Clostridia bacterium]|nr:type II secretion system protein [Clostridia bacterium]